MFRSKDSAKSVFEKVYFDKTGNEWEHRHEFKKQPGKFMPIEVGKEGRRRKEGRVMG